ncbi:MAG: DNA recombination protein RmuC [Ignavibacteria bacterium]
METAIIVLLGIILILLIISFLRRPGNLSPQTIEIEKKISGIESSFRNEFFQNRSELNENLKGSREESSKSIRDFRESLNSSLQKLQQQVNSDAKYNREELSKTLKSFESTFSNSIKIFSDTLENRMKALQEDNNAKLEKMRETVDEKLQSTLEKRLGESFKQVSERLEQVHLGLGEMKNLAVGVGDIKKVLTNIKTRGVLGEYQLENILDQLLTPEQYSKNVRTKHGSNASVEFAVKLPGREDRDRTVWLPLDSKFPTEDYQMLLNAYEDGNAELILNARKFLAKKIKDCAKDIKEKYLDPPNTTDFAIMFLPFEGLFAEVLNSAGLFETVQREYKITITGPTTLSALLNSLQMGFKTLAIERRSSEVWEILSSVKTEFGKFGVILEKTKKKLLEATNTIEDAGIRSRAIVKKLNDVQSLPSQTQEELFIDEGIRIEEEIDPDYE